MAAAEARVRRAVRPMFNASRPAAEIRNAATQAAADGLTAAEIKMTIDEEAAWCLNRRRRDGR